MAKRGLLALVAVLVAGLGRPANAHPVPFSYLDLRLEASAVELTLVAHAYDLAHDLGLNTDAPDQLLTAQMLETQRQAIADLVAGRLEVAANGRALDASPWSEPEALVDRQSIRMRTRFTTTGAPGSVTVTAKLFPYDPRHQTFVNFYEAEDLTAQAILDTERSSFEYFAGTRQGTLAVIKKFVPAGVHHILIGPDHLLFLVGLLLLGGTLKQLLLVVTGFTVAHSITLSLAALNIVTPPARLIEPAIALSIVYVGADNLLVRGGRDVRGWIAFVFGFIHGFGFANVLREMDLPRRALGWSLFSFNIGVELGQLLVVVLVASALAAVRARSEIVSRRLAVAGSIIVIAAGAFWFIQRVFFTGGTA
jgi:hydrogenase/urease accessory protein HupE